MLLVSGTALAMLGGVGFANDNSLEARAERYEGRYPNPRVFEAVSLPVLGEDWVSRVDLSDHPGVVATLVAVSTGEHDFRTPIGGLLLDPRVIVRRDVALRDGNRNETVHAFRIPKDTSLAGMELASQAALVSADRATRLRLTNGIRLRLGFEPRTR